MKYKKAILLNTQQIKTINFFYTVDKPIRSTQY